MVYPVPMAPMTGAVCYHQDRSSMVEFALRERELAREGEGLTNEKSRQLSGQGPHQQGQKLKLYRFGLNPTERPRGENDKPWILVE